MPLDNLSRFYLARFNSAVEKYNSGDSDGCLEIYRDLLLDPQLPRLYRLRTNLQLACESDDWWTREDYRLAAERVYADIRVIHPEGDTVYPVQEEKLQRIREVLDDIAEEQAEEQAETGSQEDFVHAGHHDLAEERFQADTGSQEDLAEPQASRAAAKDESSDLLDSSQATHVSSGISTGPEGDVEEPMSMSTEPDRAVDEPLSMSSTDIESDEDVTDVTLTLRPTPLPLSAPRFALPTEGLAGPRSPKRRSPEEEDPSSTPAKKMRGQDDS